MPSKGMTVFEHSFTLIGLVLGLALVDLLSGLVQLGRAHGLKALGLLTPMLAIHLILDLTVFWGILWGLRSHLPESIWSVLGFSIALTCMYYVAASLVLPQSRTEKIDFDAYYMGHRRIVLGLILICFVIVTLLGSLEAGKWVLIDSVAITYIVVLTLTLLAPWRRANLIGLGCLIVIDVLTFVPQLAGL